MTLPPPSQELRAIADAQEARLDTAGLHLHPDSARALIAYLRRLAVQVHALESAFRIKHPDRALPDGKLHGVS